MPLIPAIKTSTTTPKTAPSSTTKLSFFFSSRRRHTRLTCDWSSDVCSSDLHPVPPRRLLLVQPGQDLRAAGGGRGQVTLFPVQFRAHLGQPGPRVIEAHAAVGLRALGLLKVGLGLLQIAHPEPDRGEQAIDVG